MVNYTYDALTRLTSVTSPNTSTVVATYTYDADGNMISAVNSNATDYSTYNARDMLTNQTEFVSSAKYSVLYGYDKVGNVKSMVYPDGYNVTMTYDTMNRIKTVGSFATIHYTTNNEVSTINYGDGEVATYTYDSRERPTQIAVTYDGSKRMDLNYTYDATNNVLSINTETYGYNWLNELNSTTGPWGTITYTYDGAGNMLTQVKGTTTTYSYGSYNRLNSAGDVNFTYDGNGNTLTMVNGTSSWAYGYNYANELISAKLGGTTVATYAYDANGQLLQSAETSTQVFVYQGTSQIYSKNIGTSAITKNFYADGLLIASVGSSSTDYYHQDAIGSTRLVSTSLVTTLFSSDYKPYGGLYDSSGLVSFEYTGKMNDQVTGLYFSAARWYNDGIGRFITEDTEIGNENDPESENRYIYAEDNPESAIDPTGHEVTKTTTTTSSSTTGTVEEGPSGDTVVLTTVTTITTTTYQQIVWGFWKFWEEVGQSSMSLTGIQSIFISSQELNEAEQSLSDLESGVEANYVTGLNVGLSIGVILALASCALAAIAFGVAAALPTGGFSLAIAGVAATALLYATGEAGVSVITNGVNSTPEKTLDAAGYGTLEGLEEVAESGVYSVLSGSAFIWGY